MEYQAISDPLECITSLGGLHDWRIDLFAFDTDRQSLSLHITAHFDDPLDYQGRLPAVLLLQGVTEICVDADLTEGIRISNLEISSAPPGYELEIDLNIGGGGLSKGRASIAAKFQTLSIKST